MPTASLRRQLPLFLCCAVAAAIPLPFRWSAGLLVALTVVSAAVADWDVALARLRDRKWLWPAILLFGWVLISAAWSEDRANAWAEVERKLSFIVLPVALGAALSFELQDVRRVWTAFVLALCTVALFCLGRAAGQFWATGSYEGLFYHALVRGFDANAVYMAWYSYFALCILLFFPRRDGRPIGGSLWWPALLVLLIFLTALSSRTLLALFIAVPAPLYLVTAWRNRKESRGQLIAFSVLILAVGLAVILTPNAIRHRYSDISRAGGSSPYLADYQNDPQQFNSATTRLFIWRVGWDVVREHNLWTVGAGIGDAHLVTNTRMKDLGIRNMEAGPGHSHLFDVNMHNQYLQTVVALGLPGLVLLLLIVVPPLFAGKGLEERLVWRMLALSSLLFMAQEAIFQTQAGIVFYVFFTSIFWNRSYQKMREG